MATLAELFEGYEDVNISVGNIWTVDESREYFGKRPGGGRTGKR